MHKGVGCRVYRGRVWGIWRGSVGYMEGERGVYGIMQGEYVQ